MIFVKLETSVKSISCKVSLFVCCPLRLFRFDCKSRIDKEFEKNERENIFFLLQGIEFFKQPEVEDIEV